MVLLPALMLACLFFSDDLLRLRLQSAQYDLQHDFIWVTDEADRLLQPPLLCEGWGGHLLCLSGGRFSTDGYPLA